MMILMIDDSDDEEKRRGRKELVPRSREIRKLIPTTGGISRAGRDRLSIEMFVSFQLIGEEEQ